MIYGDKCDEENLVTEIYAVIQSSNLYVYAINNPVMYIDSFGFKAGDVFTSQDEASEDWASEYYGTTDYIQMELSSFVYMVYDGDEVIGYSYTEAIIGAPNSADGFWDGKKNIPQNGVAVGWIHSHSNSKNFSDTDRIISLDNYLTGYVVVPGQSGKVDIKKYGDTRNGFEEQIIATDVAFKSLSRTQKDSLKKKYRRRWNSHIKDCPFGCKKEDWPNE